MRVRTLLPDDQPWSVAKLLAKLSVPASLTENGCGKDAARWRARAARIGDRIKMLDCASDALSKRVEDIDKRIAAETGLLAECWSEIDYQDRVHSRGKKTTGVAK